MYWHKERARKYYGQLPPPTTHAPLHHTHTVIPNPYPIPNTYPYPNPNPRLNSIATDLAKSELEQATVDRDNEKKKASDPRLLNLTLQTLTLTVVLTLTFPIQLSQTNVGKKEGSVFGI